MANDNFFLSSSVLAERKRFHFVHQKTYFFGQVAAQSETDQGSF